MKRPLALRLLPLVGLLMTAGLPVAAGAGMKPPPLKDLTVEVIFDGTFDGLPPMSATWSPNGDLLAWLQKRAKGQPALLHVMGAQGGTTRVLTTPDEGPTRLDVDGFQWSPAGDSILVESSGDLWLLDAVKETEPRRLTKTQTAESAARFSPDGAFVAFRRSGEIHSLEIATLAEKALTSGSTDDILHGTLDWVHDEEFGATDAFWWAPDSRSIAWLRFDQRDVPRYPIVDWSDVHPNTAWQHYPKAGDVNAVVRLGVTPAGPAAPVDGPAPQTRWIDVGGNPDIYLARVTWTPDGRLAVQRLDREQRHLDLLLCAPTDGRCSVALRESDSHWLNIGDEWRFLRDLKNGGDGKPGFLWGSTRDGFRHLYLYDLEGTLVRQLTQGAWEVMEVEAIDEVDGWVWFTATEKSPLERHLYRVRLDGTGFSRMTREEGDHATTVSSRGAWVDTFDTESQPTRVTVHGAEGTTLATLDEGSGPAMAGYRRGVTEFLTVPASDGTPLPAMMTKPPDFNPSRRYPVLVYVYGGPHAQVVSRSWAGARMLWHQMMAAKGIIVWSLDNRGATARGHAWETPLHRRMGQVELADQIDGVAWLKKQRFVDGGRIGLWGWSYGGYMTLYSLFNAPDVFRAGVAVAPVTDWRDYDTIYTERYMDRPADNPGGYRDASPVHKAAALKAPLLLVHGSADDNVHMQNSVQLLQQLVEGGRPVEFMLYPGKKHGIAGTAARVHLYTMITRFVERHLLDKTGS